MKELLKLKPGERPCKVAKHEYNTTKEFESPVELTGRSDILELEFNYWNDCSKNVRKAKLINKKTASVSSFKELRHLQISDFNLLEGCQRGLA